MGLLGVKISITKNIKDERWLKTVICLKYNILSAGQSGYVASKYCTIPAENCFGSGQNKWVNFSPAFQAKPSVVIGLTLVDTHKDQNVRVRAEVTQVTTTGFNIKFKPWHDSITYQIGVNWMACS